MEGYIDIKKLTTEELVGVVNLYPWFGCARKELCARMSRMGKDACADRLFLDAAMYVPSVKIISDMVRLMGRTQWTDNDVESVLKSYNESLEKEKAVTRKVYAGVGDYFSQEDYDQVRSEDDNIFSRYAAKAQKNKEVAAVVTETPEFDLFTETLAQIYAEQGYYEQAKTIYSKLILAYPEKNAYFAALIEKLNESN